jgi:DNA-binding NtrC family response regulator
MRAETERDEGSSLPRVAVAREPHLFVVLEGQRPTAGGLRCALGGVDEVRLGRTDERVAEHDGARLTIGLPDPKVSATHARIVRTGEGFRIEDAGSTNGTWVNGERVVRRELADGDFVEIGRSILRLRLELPTPDGTPNVSAADETLGLATLLPALAAEHRTLARMASSRVPVVLLGETGTGKEVTARAVHDASQRRGPFVAINCAALTETLVEAQLFGHTQGAFSGATRDAPGFLRTADQGTLFLDEIGDLPLPSQGVLLRALQEGEVVPVGGTRSIGVDLRVIAATHKPIEEMVERGEFRRDLFSRLRAFTHRLWPLRDRREDLGVLVADILRRPAGRRDDVRFTADATRALVGQDWGFNVRELVQALARALTLATEGELGTEHFALPATTRAPAAAQDTGLSPEDRALRETLLGQMRRFDGNVTAVAREMGKATMQVYRWMRRLGIDPKQFR